MMNIKITSIDFIILFEMLIVIFGLSFRFISMIFIFVSVFAKFLMNLSKLSELLSTSIFFLLDLY